MKKLIYFALFLAFFLQSVVGQKSVDFINKSKLFYTYGVKDLQMVEKHESATYSQKVKPPQLKTKQSTQSYLVNGLKYNILSEQDKTVELTFLGDSVGDLRYVGNIIVPDRIIIGNNIYTVTVIGDQAFDYCRDLTSIILPNTIISINYAAFYWCDKLTTIDLPSSLKYIGTYAFEYCYGLTSVTIPDQVEKIDDWAFDENINLEIINLPASVSSIGIGAFGFCPKLVAINVAPGNANFTSVDGVLFNKDITTIISYPNSKSATYLIPQTVDSIGDVAFGGCDKLTGIVLPQTLKSIGNSAFSNCSSLTTINFPNSLKSIGEWAFQSCSLSSIYLSESLNFIGKYAFSICPNLGSINWPSSIQVINEGMFWRSSKLLTFDVPATVTKIERVVFLNTRDLIAITVNPNNQYYSSVDGVLFNKSKTTLISYPISKSNTYIVPQTVDSIGNDGFRFCKNLISINLPPSIRSIANVAFDSCVSLKKITIESTVPPTAFVNTFRAVNKQTCVLKVPEVSISSYQTTQYWNDFSIILNKNYSQSVTLGANQSYIPVITQRGDTLISSIVDGNQWYKNNVLIEGATEQVYICKESANYNVMVTYLPSQCSSMSETVSIITGVRTLNVDFGFQIYPNPNNGNFNIKLEDGVTGDIRIELLTIEGKLLSVSKNYINNGNRIISMSNNNFSKGVYYIRILSNKGASNRLIIIQ